MTEEEARKKWCPHSFAAQPVVNEYGAEIQCAGPWMCRASECMAWRQEMQVVPLAGQPAREWPEEPTGHGYCGLAGKP